MAGKYQGVASETLAGRILEAPDFLYAACMMKSNPIFFGRGDYQRVLDLLKHARRHTYRDIGNKLILLKQGRLYKQAIQADEQDPRHLLPRAFEEGEVSMEDQYVLYNDKTRPTI